MKWVSYVVFLSDYISRQQPRPDWTALILPENLLSDDVIVSTSPAILTDTTDLDTDTGEPGEAEDGDTAPRIPPPTQPSPRGGHQLVIDCLRGNIYLFGGWDGSRDLADFWQFNIAAGKWSLVSGDTAAEAANTPDKVLAAVAQLTSFLGRDQGEVSVEAEEVSRAQLETFMRGEGRGQSEAALQKVAPEPAASPQFPLLRQFEASLASKQVTLNIASERGVRQPPELGRTSGSDLAKFSFSTLPV